MEIVETLKLPQIPNYFAFEPSAIWTRSDGRQQPVSYLLMEHINGVALMEYLNTVGQTDDRFLRYIFNQVIKALHRLHKAGVAHRDIKPENIMLDSDYNVKLIDLGFAFCLGGRQHDGFMRTQVGTPGYVAPEVMEGKPYQGETADVFSLGATMLVMRLFEYPFAHTNSSDTAFKLL